MNFSLNAGEPLPVAGRARLRDMTISASGRPTG